jgi:hypothetical protein
VLSHVKRVLRDLETRLYHDRRGFQLLRAGRIARHPVQYVRRRRAARAAALPRDLTLDPDLGYRRIEPDELPQLAQMMERAEARIEEVYERLPAWREVHGARHAINFDLLSDDLLGRCPEFLDFALSDPLLGAVVDHLGTVPVLRRLGIAYSPGGGDGPLGSQRFHIDGEDSCQVKLYVLLREVGPDDGPFHFYPAPETARIVRELPGGRPDMPHSRVRGPYLDEDVLAAASEPIQRLEGPAGTALLIDTSRCLHYGSRVAEGHERFSMHVVFRRYHAVHETPFNLFAEHRFETDPLRRAVLTGPERLPSGWYYPDPSLGPKARGGAAAT